MEASGYFIKRLSGTACKSPLAYVQSTQHNFKSHISQIMTHCNTYHFCLSREGWSANATTRSEMDGCHWPRLAGGGRPRRTTSVCFTVFLRSVGKFALSVRGPLSCPYYPTCTRARSHTNTRPNLSCETWQTKGNPKFSLLLFDS